MTEIPLVVVRAALDQMPRLTAEESLLAARRVGVGTGSFADNGGERIRAQWVQQAYPQQPKARPMRTVETIKKAGLKVFGAR